MTDARCRWVAAQSTNLLSTHLKGCATPGCEGCEPCAKQHCSMPTCSRHVSDSDAHVCTRCLGRTRANIARIVGLCTIAPVAAREAGVDSDLFAMVGPVPERSTWLARHYWIESGAPCKCATRGQICPDTVQAEGPVCRSSTCGHTSCEHILGVRVCPDVRAWLDSADDERHPLWVLGDWDMQVAEHLHHHRNLRVTIKSAGRYLDASLTDLARDPDFGFDDLARDMADCLLRVEQVLSIAEYVTKGAPCPVCRTEGRRARPLVHQYAEDATNDKDDRWTCPNKECGQSWTVDQYERYVAGEYLQQATALTASQLSKRYRVPESTIRRWANETPPRVRKRGYNGQRQQLYDVADVASCRDTDAQHAAS